ncbi:MAG: Gfo/Idh/MocA family oxidoreductase [Candidatus Latescibacterota bacterium]
MTTRRYRAAVIGATGRGGYGHGLHLAFRGLEQVEVVAVADQDEAGRARAQQECGAPRSYADWRHMLACERPDIVSVGPRWASCHLELVLGCLEAGAHVYCEKPMTCDLEEGDQIVSMAAAAGRKVAVAHQGVYLPRVQHVREQLRAGRIGRVQAIYAHGKQDQRGGGEDMIVLGTHLLNMMRFFAGDVEWMWAHVTAQGRELRPEDVHEPGEPVGPVAGDHVDSYFAFRSGVSGFFDSRANQAGGGRRYGMEIVGSEGIVSLRGGTAGELMIYPYPVFLPSQVGRSWEPLCELPDATLAEGNRLAVLDLIAAVEEGREPLSSARDAVAALEMILGAYEAQITGCRVRFPMTRRHPLAVWQQGQSGA